MKTLYESILDDEDEVMDNIGDQTIADYEKEVKHFFAIFSNGCRVTKINTNTLPVEVDIIGNYMCINRNLPDWMVIKNCKGNLEVDRYVTSLKGFPKKINGGFSCARNPNISSLKDGPQEVTGDYTCTFMPELTSLEGCPKKCNGFFCGANPKLKNLVGGPQEVTGDYNCSSCTHLSSLKGCAKKIGWNLNIAACPNLKDIKDVPKQIPGNLILGYGDPFKLEDFKKYCTAGNMPE